MIKISTPGNLNTSWYNVPISRCTLIACLSAAGVSPWDDLDELMFSSNMYAEGGQRETFAQPWIYRHKFSLTPSPGRHYFLETQGITPSAEMFLNGKQIATTHDQRGCYGGHLYPITSDLRSENVLAIKVSPTDTTGEFVQGFKDWNLAPPDNGTGIWRDVLLKETGPFILGPLGIQTEFLDSSLSMVVMKGQIMIRNLEHRTFMATVTIYSNDDEEGVWQLNLPLPPLYHEQITFNETQVDLPIWWPKGWEQQPLRTSGVEISVEGLTSDHRQVSYGIREVTAERNQHGDIVFEMNRRPFQVLGAGYAPDLFLRWDTNRFTTIAEYALDMGLNTIRLEGNLEQTELYEAADRLGIMILPGWECCGKWEAWPYNDDVPITRKTKWTRKDFATAGENMRHEAEMLQTHPSILGFMIGSDVSPVKRAEKIYIKALKDSGWHNPIISSGSNRRPSKLLGPSGMKMEGPYDYVPPNYWWDVRPAVNSERYGAAFGFGSELGAGVGTPELGSLSKFLDHGEISDLWLRPEKILHHKGTGKTFNNRKVYNDALRHRFGLGESVGLENYLFKTQMMDYEATRAQFEAYSANWKAERPATGMIYWMLNSAWPSLHWNLFDYYLRAAGAYFGAKTASRFEHVAYNYHNRSVYLINHSLDREGKRTILLDFIGINGSTISQGSTSMDTKPNTSKLTDLRVQELPKDHDVGFMRLKLQDGHNSTLSRNVYWLGKEEDKLAWHDSTWYHTPIQEHKTDFSALDRLEGAHVTVNASRTDESNPRSPITVTLKNLSPVPAVFIRLNLVVTDSRTVFTYSPWEDVVPVKWSDNYITLWPHEHAVLIAEPLADVTASHVEMGGKNIVASAEPIRYDCA